jgi:photosystem II stability/assembly factor-like uncharacterized protein
MKAIFGSTLMIYFSISIMIPLPMKQSNVMRSSVRSIVFGEQGAAWVLGWRVLARTSNGGESWSFVTLQAVTEAARISFINAAEGWCIDDQGTVGVTHDGGVSWQALSTVVPGGPTYDIGPVKSIAFADKLNGFVLDHFTLWSTEDGGTKWREQMSGEFCYLSFVNSKFGWIGGEASATGKLYKTVNGGRTWYTVNADATKGDLRGVSFVNENEGWICTNKAAGIFHSNDGGKNWTPQQLPRTDVTITSIQFLDRSEGWATAPETGPEVAPLFEKSILLHTVDGGQTWEIAKTASVRGRYREVKFWDRKDGWLYTDTGLYRTADGGRNWGLALEYEKPVIRR